MKVRAVVVTLTVSGLLLAGCSDDREPDAGAVTPARSVDATVSVG
jgi:hypothetical protein